MDSRPCAFTIEDSADPDKDPTHPDPLRAEHASLWLDAQRLQYPDPNDFSREYEISWWVGKGTRVFPQFTTETHTAKLVYNRRKVLYRGWDFGYLAPAVLIAQVDGQERLVILKEIIGTQVTTKDFAQRVVRDCSTAYPFHAAGYEDFCDPAGQQAKSIENEKSEKRDIEVLNGLSIFPRYEYGWSRKDGRALVHQLLSVRTDGRPGLLVDPGGCPILTQAFLGRYVYPERKSDNRVAEEPDDATHPYADVMAALRYLVTGLHWKLALRRGQAPKTERSPIYTGAFHGYGTPRNAE